MYSAVDFPNPSEVYGLLKGDAPKFFADPKAVTPGAAAKKLTTLFLAVYWAFAAGEKHEARAWAATAYAGALFAIRKHAKALAVQKTGAEWAFNAHVVGAAPTLLRLSTWAAPTSKDLETMRWGIRRAQFFAEDLSGALRPGPDGALGDPSVQFSAVADCFENIVWPGLILDEKELVGEGLKRVGQAKALVGDNPGPVFSSHLGGEALAYFERVFQAYMARDAAGLDKSLEELRRVNNVNGASYPKARELQLLVLATAFERREGVRLSFEVPMAPWQANGYARIVLD